ncbi:MAG TPA: 5-(carboxyamino)imidazole ribonucleotide synthase [Oceanipulchritudo sp.]|nr:5-(carboxyamino)imidazole ribonucleotide synthase [Oceanipulchritudo sp.]
MHKFEKVPHLRPLASMPAPRLGILGGGQLSKMTAAAAAKFGCEVVVLERQDDFPAHSVDAHAIIGDWDKPEDLMQLAPLVDVVTLENEFVSPEALAFLSRQFPLWPSAETMLLVQDKLRQKELFAATGLPVPRFADAPDRESVRTFGYPLVLKKRRNSYDGKGNATVASEAELEAAWMALDGDRNALYMEAFCAFETELAIIVTRGRDGSIVHYPVVETLNREHICHVVKAPAEIPAETAAEVADLAERAVTALNGVGSFGLETFLTRDGRVLVNEIAPRVHNTGHYTIEACDCSQFENHVRAVLGWPLGSTEMVAPAAVMVNLLGFADGPGLPRGLEEALRVPGAHVHVYGKTRSTRGRKMGHVTVVGKNMDEVLIRARQAADAITFGG